MWSFYFPPLDWAKSCTIIETFKVSSRLNYITVPNCLIGLNQMNPDKSTCLNLSANASIGWQVSGHSCLAFAWQELLMVPPKMHGWLRIGLPKIHGRVRNGLPKCTDSFVFLKCMDGSVRSHLRFPTQSALTRFLQSGNSGVPWPLCKKNNKITYLKKNATYLLKIN